MTVARFDAPASTSRPRHIPRPPYARREGIAFRIVRLIWLTARFTRREPVNFTHYHRRFGVSLRSFRRDLALLRQAGFHIDNDLHGGYRMLSFIADADHA